MQGSPKQILEKADQCFREYSESQSIPPLGACLGEDSCLGEGSAELLGGWGDEEWGCDLEIELGDELHTLSQESQTLRLSQGCTSLVSPMHPSPASAALPIGPSRPDASTTTSPRTTPPPTTHAPPPELACPPPPPTTLPPGLVTCWLSAPPPGLVTCPPPACACPKRLAARRNAPHLDALTLSPASSHSRLIDSCITQLKAQETCNESKEEEKSPAASIEASFDAYDHGRNPKP